MEVVGVGESAASGIHAIAGNATIASSKALIIVNTFEYLKEHPYGYLGFLGFLTIWTICALPVTPIEVCAGYVFGPIWGTLGSLTGKTLGCLGALSIGRVLGKSRGWKVPAVLDQYLNALRERPLRAMCMIRVAPIPLGVKNYGLSLVHFPDDKYPFVKYFWSCFLVGLPFSVMWGMTGHGASSLIDIVSKYA